MASKYDFSNLNGRSNTIKQVFSAIEAAIDSDSAVLITGETGTGKELVARAIHDNSPRGQKPLFAINHGAVPGEALFSELFGHCKGAFEGAIEDKVGLFEAACGSTLILDEIGDMPLNVQSELLRVLAECKVIFLVQGPLMENGQQVGMFQCRGTRTDRETADDSFDLVGSGFVIQRFAINNEGEIFWMGAEVTAQD